MDQERNVLLNEYNRLPLVGEAASISGVETRRQLTSGGVFFWLRGRLARSQAMTSNQQRRDSVSEFQTWTLGNYLLAYGVIGGA